MSDLHCRGCDCSLCLPGHRAQVTRVYRIRVNKPPRPAWLERHHERLQRQFEEQRRARKLAGQKAWRDRNTERRREYLQQWRAKRKAVAA